MTPGSIWLRASLPGSVRSNGTNQVAAGSRNMDSGLRWAGLLVFATSFSRSAHRMERNLPVLLCRIPARPARTRAIFLDPRKALAPRPAQRYSVRAAQQQMRARRHVCRPKRKLLPGGEDFRCL
ncbi:hypothetical protein C1890_15915 [Pseudomonas sp. DP16D-R1]|nr:hypothetical protein C1890_15915 [Pseudomonas sp. DP16D-R1]